MPAATPPPSSRQIARSAVRSRLSDVALDLFWRQGFDDVTVSDVASAAGVSRSTFLRHFPTKEAAVLSAFDHQGDLIAAALAERPDDEHHWTALRRSLDSLITAYAVDVDETARQVALVVRNSPVLCTGRRDQHARWAHRLATVLLGRRTNRLTSLQAESCAAAAMACLAACVDAWTADAGRADLKRLLDESFQSLAATP